MHVDQELLDLLSRLDPANREANGTEPLTDAELADARTQVLAVLADIDRTNPSAEDLAVATDGAGIVRTIDAEIERRATEASARAAELATALEGIEVPDAAPAADETPAADDAPPAVEGEAPPDGGEPVTAETPEAVAAAAAPPMTMPSLRNIAHRSPRRNRPQPTATEPIARPRLLTASGSGTTLQVGQEMELEEWAHSVARRYESVRSLTASKDALPEPLYMGQVRFLDQYPEERRVDEDRERNEERYRAVTSPQAIAASGGVCGPVAVDYNPGATIAVADRPVRNGMAMFGAGRGGVRYINPHTLAAVTNDGPANLWTQATDAAPGNSTKAHATFVCQSPTEVYVDAVTSIVQFGNFQARYFPEQIDQYLQTVDAVHARLAEATLLAAMVSGSTSINAGNNGTNQTGAASEYLAEMDRILSAFRYRHRMAEDATLQLWYPEWFEDMMRADLARELPGNSGSGGERLAVADAEIERFLTTRNVSLTTFLDNPTGYTPVQGFGVQNAGDALPWPTKVLSFLTTPGAWTFLDGGELNLGMVRDSTLNRTNDFQMFSETFEKAVFRGHESLAITMDLCPDGARAATVDTTNLCATGS